MITGKITGSIVALVTPMLDDGSVDYAALRRLIDWHIEEGTDCLRRGRHHRRIADGRRRRALRDHPRLGRAGRGRVPVMAGTGANSTGKPSNSPSSPRRRRRLPPCWSALLQQADAGRHLPALQGDRRGRRHPADSLQRARPHRRRHAARHRGAAGRAARHHRHQGSHRRHRAGRSGPPACRFRGLFRRRPDRSRQHPARAATATSVTANVAPEGMAHMCAAALAGDAETAAAIDADLAALHRALFVEPNPIPVKWALASWA